MEELGTKCRDVRTREVGIVNIHHNVRLHFIPGALCELFNFGC
jgi:hypothetical protein